ncbi:MAG: glycosyltransferase family 1 protein [Propionibacteriaceae bacterium]|nr:glycosyltransferase family 1 protein [Propionibacteriaceae bacterium]
MRLPAETDGGRGFAAIDGHLDGRPVRSVAAGVHSLPGEPGSLVGMAPSSGWAFRATRELPMKVLLIAAGGRGKVEPFLALGRGLRAAGHEPVVAAPGRFTGLARNYGVGFTGLDDSLFALRERLDDAGVAVQRAPYLTEANLQRWLDSLARLTQLDPDVVMFNPKALGAASIAEKLRVPVLPAQLVPVAPSTREFAAPGAPLWTPSVLHRWTWRMTGVDPRAWRVRIARWRSHRLGLPAQGPGFADLVDRHGVLSAWSRHVLPAPADWPEAAAPLGFWTASDGRAEVLPDGVEQFLAGGEPPVLVVLDDLLGPDAKQLAQSVAEGLRSLNRRGLLVVRGSGLDDGLVLDDLYLVDHLPFSAIMPRVAAVVHQGGNHTMAAALAAGIPQVTHPFYEDQLFWADRLYRIGAAPEPLDRLSSHSLAYALEDAMDLQPSIRQLQAALTAEDGVAAAVVRLGQAVG